jgi:hypothetical protein
MRRTARSSNRNEKVEVRMAERGRKRGGKSEE